MEVLNWPHPMFLKAKEWIDIRQEIDERRSAYYRNKNRGDR